MQHETYGKRLTRAEELQLFGQARGRGVQLAHDGTVAWIYVTVGARMRYPNAVACDTVHYCYSPVDRANAAMKKAYEQGHAFRVRVAPDAATNTYYWGRAKVVQLHETIEHNASTYERYVLARVREDDETEETTPYSSSPSAALDALATAATHAIHTTKRARVEEGTAARTAIQVTTTDGVTFDSLLERKHAVMLTALGVRWTRNAPTFHDIVVTHARVVSYTPDFVLYTPHEGAVYVEIKPRYPYDDELLKCMGACELTRAPFYLMYNTRFVLPFALRAEGPGQGDYAHHEGVRGIRFAWDGDRVRVTHDAAYIPEGLAARERAGEDDARFYDARVLLAYVAADKACA